MKLLQVRNYFGILSLILSMMMALMVQAQQAPDGVAASAPPPPLNPNAIAQLRWYEINRVAPVILLPTIHSAGIAFDGANMWVTGFYENTVTKIRASDCAVLGRFSVGEYPGWRCFRRSKRMGIKCGDGDSDQASSCRREGAGYVLGGK